MMGRPWRVEWRPEDTAEALKAAYQRERDPEVRTRLHGLWLLRSGRRLGDTAAVVGVHYRSVQRWVEWYRTGGVAAVCAHHAGGHGQPSRLTPEQEAALAEEAAKGSFTTTADALAWVAQQFGVSYRPKGMYTVLQRIRCRPKVPRPIHVKADPDAQAAWKKGAVPVR